MAQGTAQRLISGTTHDSVAGPLSAHYLIPGAGPVGYAGDTPDGGLNTAKPGGNSL